MFLEPADIVAKTFPAAKEPPGYDVGAVDSFLQEVAEELRRLQREGAAVGKAHDTAGASDPHGLADHRDRLRAEVDQLQAELERLQKQHHDFRERAIESVREHLHLLEAGRDQLPPHGTVLHPPVR
ncbi:DivIVA domain-containing protein [Ornithinimicrobium sp. CNJ-824]|uniref:DivIVA domain-containing protein n=1 Tax=Ornithinimicrobium sp. CNJ-824 TaxID=1904966 RepID=UPI00096A8AF9|nr:DivIVA domain-containing protein [Ornithinimicrobium sp. CNJ-824]